MLQLNSYQMQTYITIIIFRMYLYFKMSMTEEYSEQVICLIITIFMIKRKHYI